MRSRSIDIDPDLTRIAFRGKWLPMTVVRSNRTTYGLTINPDQSVILRLPLDAPDSTTLSFLERKEEWIYRQLVHFEQFLPHTPQRQYVGGETHHYLGKPYRLRIHESKTWKISRGAYYISIGTPFPDRRDLIREHYLAWLKERAVQVFGEIHNRLGEQYSGRLGFWLPTPEVKFLRSSWGKYDPGSDSYALNVLLVQSSVPSIEYVILHEICHHKYPQHDSRFYDLLGKGMPDWAQRKLELERTMT